MEIKLFRKGDRTPLIATKKIPAAYEHLRLAQGSTEYIPLGNAGLMKRVIKTGQYRLAFLDAWADEVMNIEVATSRPQIIILYFLSGRTNLQAASIPRTGDDGMFCMLFLAAQKRVELCLPQGEHRLILSCTDMALYKTTAAHLPALHPLINLTGEARNNAGPKLLAKGPMSSRTCIALNELLYAAVKESFLPSLHMRIFLLFVESLRTMDDSDATNRLVTLSERLLNARQLMDAQHGKTLRIPAIARKCHMNRGELKTGFRLMFGESIGQYQILTRMNKGIKQLVETDESIQLVSLGLGYDDASSFSRRFKLIYGMTPLQYRKQHRHK